MMTATGPEVGGTFTDPVANQFRAVVSRPIDVDALEMLLERHLKPPPGTQPLLACLVVGGGAIACRDDGTAVFFHAHPDDEAIQTGGTMARMAADGHRVVLVTATRGELGEVPEGLLAPGEILADRRAVELAAACAVLGVARHEYLGYRRLGDGR